MRSFNWAILRMTQTSPPQSKPLPETHLQRTLTSVINELPVDAALAALFHRDQGPLVSHAVRGFTPRDIQAILRTLSASTIAAPPPVNDQESGRTIRLRLITPGTKSLLGIPLHYRNKTYGFLVIGRKESATFISKRPSRSSAFVTSSLACSIKLFSFFANATLSFRPMTRKPYVLFR